MASTTMIFYFHKLPEFERGVDELMRLLDDGLINMPELDNRFGSLVDKYIICSPSNGIRHTDNEPIPS